MYIYPKKYYHRCLKGLGILSCNSHRVAFKSENKIYLKFFFFNTKIQGDFLLIKCFLQIPWTLHMINYGFRKNQSSIIKSGKLQEANLSESLTAFYLSFSLPLTLVTPPQLLHLLWKEVNGRVKNLGVIPPHWCHHISRSLFPFFTP